MKKLAIIGNPKAGNGALARCLHEGRSSIWGWDCDFITTTSSNHLTQVCASLRPHEYEAAIVAGGDGTIHHAIKGLVKNDLQDQVPLYAFPAGTANDFARELGTKANWDFAQNLIQERRQEVIDLIEVNGVPFATVAGIGLGAQMTEEFNRRRQDSKLFRFLYRTFKHQLYTTLSIRTILMNWGQTRKIHVESGFFEEKIKTSVVFICNQSQLGGDLTVAHDQTNTNKKFKVLLIPRPSGIPMLRALKAMKEGKFPDDFISFYSDHLRLTDVKGNPITVFGDGETLTQNVSLEFKILPSKLKVFSARAASLNPLLLPQLQNYPQNNPQLNPQAGRNFICAS